VTTKFLATLVAFGLLVAADSAAAQERTVTVPASTEYERSGLYTTFWGETWRDVWRTPITVPVLDLDTFAGGLKAFEAGGNQSRTLRLKGQDGRTYMFRSVNKDVQRRALPEDLRNTPAGRIIQDQTSSMHPSAPVVIGPFQEALGLLYAPTKLIYLPDHPTRLGEWREAYANSLGFVEERPEDAEDGSPPFAGAEKIQNTEKVLENLEESMEDRFESRDYLTVRLLDFIIGDTDRGADQWRYAKMEAGARDVYRPIPRDRDYAFMNADGMMIKLAAMFYPKLTHFTDDFPQLKTVTFMTREFDRSHLVDISPEQWDSIVGFIQRQLTDDLIDRAVAVMPEPHQRLTADEIKAGLRERRDDLDEIADEYYAMVNNDADVFASDEDERAEIDRNADGSVRVRIWRELKKDDKPEGPVFDRRFAPGETDEVRVYLERGKDYAVVRGTAASSIEVRVIGGEGDDVLIDSSHVTSGDKTQFYDAHGNNTVVRGTNTNFSSKPFVTLPPKCSLDDDEKCEEKKPRVLSEERRGRQQDLVNDAGTFIDQKTKSENTRSWGKTSSWGGMIAYRESDGVIVGLGPSTTDYGFRRRPFEWQTEVRAMVAPRTLDFGVKFEAERHFENSPWSVGLAAHATQLESNRFFGYGNNTPLIPRSQSIVPYDEVLVRPLVNYQAGANTLISFGPEARLVSPDVPAGSATSEGELGDFGQVGGRVEVISDHATRTPVQQSGVALHMSASAYPAVWDAAEAFGDATAVARLYVPVGSSTVALRAGGQRVWGTFPLHNSAFVGGSGTVRGYQWNRFAGDAAAFGSAELRLPVMRVTLLTRGQLGILGFTDAGRVWMDGISDGGWHTSYGGGLWFGSLGQAVSVTYAHGEEGRFYIGYGLPF
jgi:hypothetical protein